jgi:hypothetical protein
VQPPAPQTAAGDVGPSQQPNYVLLEKGSPVRVMNPQNVVSDTMANPISTRGYNSLIVDLLPGPGAAPTSVTVLGSPTPGGPWLQEVDNQAFKSGVSTITRFVVTGVSAYNAVALSVPLGWTVWFTPFNAASQTNVTITGTTSQNLAQYGGIAVGPSNPLDVRPNGAVDVSDRAARQLGTLQGTSATSVADGQNAALGTTTDAAVTTNAAGTASGKLRGLVAFFAAIASITFGWVRVLAQPSTWNLNGTSAANTAQTVTQAAAGAGVKNYLTGLTVSWANGAPAAGTNVQVKDGATVIWDQYLGQAGGAQGFADFEFTSPLPSSANAALAVVIAAAGGTTTTKISAQGTTGP